MTCDRIGGTLAAASPNVIGLLTALYMAFSTALGLNGPGTVPHGGLQPRRARLTRHLPGGGNLPVLPSGWWLVPMTASGAAIWLALALAALASRHPGLLP